MQNKILTHGPKLRSLNISRNAFIFKSARSCLCFPSLVSGTGYYIEDEPDFLTSWTQISWTVTNFNPCNPSLYFENTAFVLLNSTFFIQLSCTFGRIWWSKMEKSWVKICHVDRQDSVSLYPWRRQNELLRSLIAGKIQIAKCKTRQWTMLSSCRLKWTR